MRKNELTNEEIVKDIERSTGMPSYWKTIVLDLINRQQSEIERLTEEVQELKQENSGLSVTLDLQRDIDKEYDEIERKNAEPQKQVNDLKEEHENMQSVIFGLEEDKRQLQKQVIELKEKIMNLKTAMISRVAMKSYDSLLTIPDDVEEIFGDAYESEFNGHLEQAVKDTAKEILQKIMNIIKKSDGFLAEEVIRILAKQKGVEVE